jgi:hypothetical protein
VRSASLVLQSLVICVVAKIQHVEIDGLQLVNAIAFASLGTKYGGDR